MTDGTEGGTPSDTPPRVTAVVAAILNDREVVLDAGEAIEDVAIGTRFAVLVDKQALTPSGRPFVVKLPKAIVKVTRFEDSDLAVARTFLVVKGRPARRSLAFGSSFQDYFNTPAVPDSTQTISFDEDEVLRLSAEERVVRKGDVAVQILGDEYYDDTE